MYRLSDEGTVEVLLVHPGGPFFAKKDDGVWTIPKGMPDPGEELLECAKREFREETGFDPGAAPFRPLGEVKQKGGKTVHAWAFPGECDPAQVKSNTCMFPKTLVARRPATSDCRPVTRLYTHAALSWRGSCTRSHR